MQLFIKWLETNHAVLFNLFRHDTTQPMLLEGLQTSITYCIKQLFYISIFPTQQERRCSIEEKEQTITEQKQNHIIWERNKSRRWMIIHEFLKSTTVQLRGRKLKHPEVKKMNWQNISRGHYQHGSMWFIQIIFFPKKCN